MTWLARSKEESLLAPILEGNPNPTVLKAVRKGYDLDGFDPAEVEEAKRYLEQEKASLPEGGFPIVETSTGKVIAVLKPEHLWTPPPGYRETEQGDIVESKGIPIQRIHPEIYAFLVTVVGDRERYNRAWVEKYQGKVASRADLPLAFPEGRARVAEEAQSYLRSRFRVEGEVKDAESNLIVLSYPVVDARAANPRYSARVAVPLALERRIKALGVQVRGIEVKQRVLQETWQIGVRVWQ